MDDEVIVWYRQGALTCERLQAAVDEAVTDLAADDEALSELRLSPAEAGTARFVVTEEGGIIAETILLGIVIGAGGNIAADAVKALWKKVLQRVKENEGDDAVGPEERPGQADDAG